MTPNTLAPDVDHEFPSSDGTPMSENTRQYEAIVTLKGNIEAFAPATAFVAGDHLIYVDLTDGTARQAPDVYVAFGRPRGHRGSYKLWEEDGVFPQVVFEVLAPSNTAAEMRAKRAFYFRYGAEEYYEFDPEAGTWTGFVRDAGGAAVEVPEMDGHVSPRLGMRFGFRPLELRVFRPDGTPFLSFQELEDDRIAQRDRADAERRAAEEQRQRAEGAERRAGEQEQRAADAQQRAEVERQRAEEERQRAEGERRRADEERRRAAAAQQRADEAQREAERVRALLRAAGIDPDATT
jgi:Uma2 family endonuclease